MEVNLDCIPCFQRQALQAARFITKDECTQEEILREVMSELMSTEWNTDPPKMSLAVHSIVREKVDSNDPYSKVKKRDNDIAMEKYDDLKNLIEEANDSFETAVRLAIAGNIIDFGANEDFDLDETIDEVLEQKFSIDDSKKLRQKLEKGSTIVYLVDNCGEIVLDKLFLETILQMFDIKKISIGVKGGPIINDATKEDALYVGLDKLDPVEFFEVSNGEPRTGPERGSEELKRILNKGDVIISKGQGNYEGLSEISDIFFLLMAKCSIIAEKLDAEEGDIILKHS
ncbi:MAG: putative ATP-grasp domain fused to redox center [Candidatus Methanohalarchaeum thermophilum]|uniref:ATP-grasp domain fused to redox center n=1 Tax=Methanohalarchaeum thermophilum TaxID=1903181 RepID=A0A1Q6DWM8_METT1|nr:MAG: putative ATP-grasp domain fused to redox center [Candidatus Methanohalarchaeum thermophilum]